MSYFQEYYNKNKEAIKKNVKLWRKNNKDKNKGYRKINHKNNKIKDNKYSKDVRDKKSAIRNKIKIQYGCMNPECKWKGDFPSYCLDFHHIDKKSFNIGSSQHAMKTQIKEINKCTILCAMCHRLETWGELDTSKFPKCNVDIEGNKL